MITMDKQQLINNLNDLLAEIEKEESQRAADEAKRAAENANYNAIDI